MKILTIIGARPQFVKASTLSRYINNKFANTIEEIIVHTGQHYDKNMSEIFFEDLKIPSPKYNLGIGGLRHGEMTGQMIKELEKIALIENPNWILVYGDTNSTLAGSIVASKLHIPLAHVEAGLRSFNNKMPEEINRIITDRISNLLFCPTSKSFNNLKNEGYLNFKDKKIINSGDIMYESAIHYKSILKFSENLRYNEKYVLCTIHRAETTDNPSKLNEVIEALNTISKSIKVIVPMHPRTLKILKKLNILINFDIIKPVGYIDMLGLISNSEMIMTDSGGLQKEAYFFEKVCLTLREETEWTELVETGNNILVSTDKKRIIDVFSSIPSFKKNDDSIYGTGNTCEIIIKNILEYNL